MNKREARLARAALKKLQQEDKSARLRDRPAENGAPRIEMAPQAREVRTGADPGSIYQMQMEWSDGNADREGTWSWGHERDWGDEVWKEVIEPKIVEFGRLLWREIEAMTTDTGHRSHHPMDVEIIHNDAISRLYEIEQYQDSIYRFRLGNRRRLWGFRTVNVFEILWYDPEHNIYRVEPD